MNINNRTREKEILDNGWTVFRNAYQKKLINEIRSEILNQEEKYLKLQRNNNLKDEAKNTMHHIALMAPSSIKLIDPNPIHKFLQYYFESKYILNTMGTTMVRKANKVYTQKVHRDVRSFSNQKKIMLIAIMLLDDSTLKNGATWILKGSAKLNKKPDDKYFFDNGTRVLGKKGDIILFDGNVWHASGINITSKPRVIVTAAFTKPYIKQGLDYPRAFGLDYRHSISDQLKQTLGYNAMTPSNIDEFYKPKDLRCYQTDQG
jgi:ectoine hydroxylase-related dioxygenase (phytanoyl-CoA dioxygenase family)